MKVRKIMALLLCLVILTSMLTACGKKKDITSDDSTSTNSSTTENGSTDSPSTEEEVLTELPLPLTAEKESLSVWTFFANDFVEDPNDIKGIQKMEEITNVHIEWQTALTSEISEKYGLMLAAGDYPDIINFATVNADRQYAGGMEKAIEDGVLIDSTPLIEKYMPNYRKVYEEYEEAGIETLTDTGLRTIWSYSASDQGPQGENEWCGMVIRQDWLDDLGLKVPETLDEWHTVLTAFKNEKGADAPMLIGSAGPVYNGAFLTAFGILPGYYQVDGQVMYGPAQPEYKEYLELMSQWYAEGLIDPNFMSNNSTLATTPEYTATGRAGAWCTFYSMANDGMVTMGLVSDDPDFYAAAVPNPVKNAGDEPIVVKIADGIVNSMLGISTNCDNPELAAMWVDFQYSQQGMLLNMYGIEGESYTIAEDGSYQFTDQILNNSEGMSPTDALSLWARGNGLGMYNWETAMRTYANYDDILDIESVWTNQDMSLCLPKNMFMTAEEANIYNSVYTAINTFVQENTVNWITGAQSLDNFDDYVTALYDDYNLQECIDIKQNLLNRYNARK